MNSGTKIDLSIVIPLYNEADSLEELYNQIMVAVRSTSYNCEVIFIDDGSTDNSIDVLKKLHSKNTNLKIYQFRKNFGKSAALAYGFSKVRGDIVITMDADLQDDPKEIPALINKLNEGYDLVSGWKKKRYDPFIRRISSRFYNRVTSMVAGLKLHDFNCGLKAYRKEVVKEIPVYGQMHRYLPVLAHWRGFRVGEIVVQHHARKYGASKFGPWRFMAGLLDILTVSFLNRFDKRPLHLFGSIGIVSFSLGAIICIYLAVYWMFVESSLSNRPILFLGILLIIVGIQVISLGLLGEMITATNNKDLEYSIRNSYE